MNIADIPIPKAYYLCASCCEDYSWPAEDLNWSEKTKQWICHNCWDREVHGEHGPSLDEVIKARTTLTPAIAEAPSSGRPKDHVT